MTCLECNTPLSYLDHRKAIERFGFELCQAHRERMERLLRQKDLPEETVILYYGLKEAHIPSMLAWWDGRQTIDLAISRVKLNIRIDIESEELHSGNIMDSLENGVSEFKDGFTNIRIPHTLIRKDLRRTVEYIEGVIHGLRAEIKAI